MPEQEIIKIADEADMIVRGYAFKRKGAFISVLNLNSPDRAVMLSECGDVIESNTDPIEETIIKDIWKKDKVYMEAVDA